MFSCPMWDIDFLFIRVFSNIDYILNIRLPIDNLLAEITFYFIQMWGEDKVLFPLKLRVPYGLPFCHQLVQCKYLHVQYFIVL